MGMRILIVTLASLIMLGFIDAFINWYRQFLDRRFPFPNMKPVLIHFIWVILAIVFWLHISFRHLPESLDMSHFLFAAFIYSLKGLLSSFLGRESAAPGSE